MGLSYNWSSISGQVDSLYPEGATNQPIGLVWGWQSLVGGGPPSAPAKNSSYTYIDVIILLSDGLNTLDRWYGSGSIAVPAVQRVEAVREQDNDVDIGVTGILGRRARRAAADQRLPAPDQADRLIGGAFRIQAINLARYAGTVVAEAHDGRRAV